MLNPFYIQKTLLNRLSVLDSTLAAIRQQICSRLIQKSNNLRIPLSVELQHKCQAELARIDNEKQYRCKYCQKLFGDGRQLGGHVSRAHKNMLNGPKLIEQEQPLRKAIKSQEYYQSDDD